MRAIWKGAIAFGLVNVPVKVYSATEDHDISLHQVHNADGGRIRYQRRCEVCSKVIDYEDIDKAYEDDGRTVILSREELKSIPAENSHEIEVVQFVPADQLDPMMFEKSYYLEPDAKSPKAYMLREKTRLGALRIRGDVLVLQSLLWADEVREANFPALETTVRISAQEREMSAALVDSMAADFDPAQFTDDYQLQLRQLIDAKIEQGDSLDTEETFGAPAAEAGTGEVIDLMDALKRSIERKRGGGSDGGASEGSSGGSARGAATSGTTKTAAAKTGTAKTSTAKSGSAKTGTAKRAAAKTGAAKAGAGTSGSTKTASTKTAASKTSPAKTSAAKSGTAKTAARKGA